MRLWRACIILKELSPQLRKIIDYDLYKTHEGHINSFRERLNALLARHTTGKISLKIKDIDDYEQFNIRCVRTAAQFGDAYDAFVRDNLGKRKMMIVLHSMRTGGDTHLTTIDAIADINHFGLKIYQKNTDSDTLSLLHEYMPENATKIAYLYHEGVHFQALLPETLSLKRMRNQKPCGTQRTRASKNAIATRKRIVGEIWRTWTDEQKNAGQKTMGNNMRDTINKKLKEEGYPDNYQLKQGSGALSILHSLGLIELSWKHLKQAKRDTPPQKLRKYS